MLGSEVDKLSNLFFIKILNAAEYIKSDIQNTQPSSIDDPII